MNRLFEELGEQTYLHDFHYLLEASFDLTGLAKQVHDKWLVLRVSSTTFINRCVAVFMKCSKSKRKL